MRKKHKYPKKVKRTLDSIGFTKAMMKEGKRLQEKVYAMGPQAVKEVGEALDKMIKEKNYE